MNPNAAKKGRSFKGAVAYIVHDPDQSETDERVLFTETRNLRTDDPEKAAKVMAYTAKHANDLKEASGVKATGRKTDSPVYHLSLSWIPGEKPTQAEMMEAGTAVLEKLGYREHEAVFAAHGDKAHMHLHIVVNRIHPVTGKTHNPKDDQKILQAWAHEYDKARGMEHHSPNRAAKHEKRGALREEYQKQADKGLQKPANENKSDNNKNRAQWNSEQGATYPKSRRYKEIQSEFGARGRELAASSRAQTVRHKKEWENLKTKQDSARAALRENHTRTKTRASFNTEAKVPKVRYTFQQFQADRVKLQKAQREEFLKTIEAVKEKNAPEIQKFTKAQKEERLEVMKQIKDTRTQQRQTMQAVTNTPLSSHGPEHRDHLGKVFKDRAMQEEKAFERDQKEKRDEFMAELKDQDKPQFDQLREAHNAQRQALRGRYKTAKEEPEPTTMANQRSEKAELAKKQKTERDQLRRQQTAERKEQQEKWTEMTAERTKAWEQYREHRATQEKGEVQDNSNRESFQRVADPGRAEQSRADPGRFNSRDGGGDSGRSRDFNGHGGD